ncbi:ABC transporter substrate-binding protein [Antricoccus suffuscus]|nr:ABC transporter substrate-binding protein [Antricoccus suffuscus]
MGYWKDQGLTVQIQPTAGATASAQLLTAGKADIIAGGTSSLYQAAAADPKIRLVSLQAENFWQIAVPEDSKIKSIDDLKGKTIGTQSLSSASYLFGRAAVQASGLDPDSDVKWLVIGVGSQAAAAIKDGTVAAYASYDGPTGVVSGVLGKKLINLPTPLDKVSGLSGYATTEQFLKEHKSAIVKFLLGTYKGYIFSTTNPGAAEQIQWAEYPEQKPKGMSTEEAIQSVLPNVESRFKSGSVPGPSGLIGDVPMKDVQDSIDFMVKYGVLKASLDSKKVVDLSLNKEANKFDADAVKKQAQNWKP